MSNNTLDWRRASLTFAGLGSAVLLLTGCIGMAPKKVDPQSYTQTPIQTVENQQTIPAGRKPKVVIFKTDENADIAKKYGLSDPATGAIENQLSESVEVVDRSLSKKLKQEIILGEMHGQSSSGPSVANFAVLSEINIAKWDKSYSAAYNYVDKKGKTHYKPARCSHTASIEGNVKIYELPDMSLVKNIKITGKKSKSEDARYTHCPIAENEISGLLASAAANAITSEKVDLLNVFAPVGYVTERRDNEDASIFRITLGRQMGAVAGEKVQISRKVKYQQLGKEATEVIRMGEASIVEPVEREYSWIYIKDNEQANKLKAGDKVKLVYKNNLFGFLKNKLDEI